MIDGHCGFLMLTKGDKPVIAADLESIMRRAVNKYNRKHPDNPLPRITPHTFRHTLCSNLLNRGMSAANVAAMMGHDNPTTTMKYYAHANNDRVSGLEMGADDYIVKPLEMPEVIARVRAVFRRMAPDDAPEKLSFDNLVIDKQAYDLVIKGKRVDAPPKEIELLYFLASSPNRVFTRAQLLDDVWGFDYFGDTRTVDVHVKRLREKLEGVSDKWELKTVWGVGYKFETKE